MEFLSNIFGPDIPMAAQLAIAIVAALIALLIIFWLFRKIFGKANSRMAKSRQPRLSITDAAIVDDKRRLVLVRRDAVEHLIMIGGPTDIVIEQNIVRTAPVHVPQSHSQAPEFSQVPAPVQQATKPEAPTVREPVIKEPKPEPSSNTAAAKLGLATAAGAGLATIASDASSSAANAASNVSEKAADTLSTVTTNADRAASGLADDASQTASALRSNVETEITGDLRADLENVFGGSDNNKIASSEPSFDNVAREPQTDGKKQLSTDDEMKRLLEELSAGN